jgi:hypothetical protein
MLLKKDEHEAVVFPLKGKLTKAVELPPTFSFPDLVRQRYL